MTTTWRDIADQLTDDQIANLALMERRGEPADRILAEARTYATVNLWGVDVRIRVGIPVKRVAL